MDVQVNHLMDQINEHCLNSPSDLMSQILLPWDKFSHWVNAIVVVTFDIELGQSLEVWYSGLSC